MEEIFLDWGGLIRFDLNMASIISRYSCFEFCIGNFSISLRRRGRFVRKVCHVFNYWSGCWNIQSRVSFIRYGYIYIYITVVAVYYDLYETFLIARNWALWSKINILRAKGLLGGILFPQRMRNFSRNFIVGKKNDRIYSLIISSFHSYPVCLQQIDL